jgi:hypothetical protein
MYFDHIEAMTISYGIDCVQNFPFASEDITTIVKVKIFSENPKTERQRERERRRQ